MTPFTKCVGHGAVLLRDDIDTDLIVRIERIAQLKRGEFAKWAFESLRYRSDGSEEPAFVLNRVPFRDAEILITGANFGCGSSREMAVWALEDFGIRCVIAPSYGDIFYNNCLQNGLLPVRMPAAQIATLASAASSGLQIRVDLSGCTVEADGLGPVRFDFDEGQRLGLLNGLDDIDQSVALEPSIGSFQDRDRSIRPWIYAAAQAAAGPSSSRC